MQAADWHRTRLRLLARGAVSSQEIILSIAIALSAFAAGMVAWPVLAPMWEGGSARAI